MRDSADVRPAVTDEVRWSDVWLGFGVAVAATFLLGAPLFLVVERNVWWPALAGVLGLVAGGWLVARRRGRSDALSATLVAILYFGVVLVVLLGGTLLGLLPDPLPGLPIGDSTFFFVWPLTQLAAAVAGSALGGGWRRWTAAATTWRRRWGAPRSRH